MKSNYIFNYISSNIYWIHLTDKIKSFNYNIDIIKTKLSNVALSFIKEKFYVDSKLSISNGYSKEIDEFLYYTFNYKGIDMLDFTNIDIEFIFDIKDNKISLISMIFKDRKLMSGNDWESEETYIVLIK